MWYWVKVDIRDDGSTTMWECIEDKGGGPTVMWGWVDDEVGMEVRTHERGAKAR